MNWMLRRTGQMLARHLSQPSKAAPAKATCTPELLASTLRKGDVLLVDGITRFGSAIKYLTQSCWSHSALCVENPGADALSNTAAKILLEADVNVGVRRLALGEYAMLHTRICRPVGLSPAELDSVVQYALSRVGQTYDLKNIFDLARYLIRRPPLPHPWRRRLLALGSGDPTKAICSSLIAQAFQKVRYPILPDTRKIDETDTAGRARKREVMHIRHHSLFTPRDFDVSPYFKVVKPTLEQGFNFRAFEWADEVDDPDAPASV
jgi:hypothetical protein